MSLPHLKEDELVQLYQLQQGQERWDDWCRLIDHVRYSEARLSETREALDKINMEQDCGCKLAPDEALAHSSAICIAHAALAGKETKQT